MKVYITYDRYERDEWYNIYHTSTDKEESIKHCKEVDLPSFLEYGPDDCHSFQLQEVEMTQEEYDQFMKWYNEDQSLENYGDRSSDLFKKMVEFYDQTGYNDPTVLISTDGCSDFYDILKYYGQMKGIDPEDFDDLEDDLQMELCEDDELYKKVLRQYINDTY